MRAVILERNKLVGRKVARYLFAAGAEPVIAEDPATARAAAAGADLFAADAFDGELVAELVRAHSPLRGLLWTAEPIKHALRYLADESARISHVLARRDFESPPRGWELAHVVRRLAGGPAVPLGAYVGWGATMIDLAVRGTADRDPAIARIEELVTGLGVPRRLVELVGELAHELLMNAIYDAPADRAGHAKYAADRKADVRLADNERPAVRVATDGTYLALQVRDPFGRLERRHVVDGLARGLAGGEMDREGGGAGLGLTLCHNASSSLVFDVVRGRHTEVTAIVELDANLRELRTQAKSLHLWSA
jgi:hypothetical protein